jgi:hypothetical protein
MSNDNVAAMAMRRSLNMLRPFDPALGGWSAMIRGSPEQLQTKLNLPGVAG